MSSDPFPDLHRYEFFSLIQLLEQSAPEAAPIGHLGPPRQEALRLRPHLSLGFPARDVEALEKEDGRWRMTVTFLGLYGSDSPLPPHYTELLLHGDGEGTETLRAFLDLFHHRLLSLYYRTFQKYQLHASLVEPSRNPLLGALARLAGRDPADTSSCIPSMRFLRYTGLLAQRPLSAAALEAALSDFFEGIAVRIEQCVPRWVDVPESSLNSLGVLGCTLGQDLTLGGRVGDRSGRLRVCVGPLGWADYQDFLPGGMARDYLEEMVAQLKPDHLEHEVSVAVRGDEVPALALDGRRDRRLGWTTWLSSSELSDQTVHFAATEETRKDS